MAHRFRVVLFAVLAFVSLISWPAACDAPAPDERPSPLEWDQWQPQIDRSDSRLDLVVSVWEQDTRLDELLARLSEVCGVTLNASENLLPQRLILLSRDRSLAGVMVGLAHLYEGYWVYRREQAPQERTYFLLEFAAATAFMDWACEGMFRELTGESVSARGQSLRRRLSLYKTALSLRPETVLARFEKDDPWLCADVLRPSTRPLVALICDLGEERLRGLTERSVVVLEQGELSPSLRASVRDWRSANDMWDYQGSSRAPDLAALSGSVEPDGDRAMNPMLKLRWNGIRVEFRVVTPERTYTMWVVSMPDVIPPRAAREQLLELRHEKATAEMNAAMDKEQEEWEQSHPDWFAFDVFEGTDSDRQSPHASSPVNLAALDDTAFTAFDLLGAVGEQCDLAVVSDALPGGANWPHASQPSGQVTVADVLYAIYCVNGVEWRFRGAWLVITRDEPRLAEDNEPVDIEEWAHLHHPVAGALLEDLSPWADAVFAAP